MTLRRGATEITMPRRGGAGVASRVFARGNLIFNSEPLPTGRLWAGGSGAAGLYDLADGGEVRTFPVDGGQTQGRAVTSDRVYVGTGLAYSHTGVRQAGDDITLQGTIGFTHYNGYIYTVESGTVRAFDVATGLVDASRGFTFTGGSNEQGISIYDDTAYVMNHGNNTILVMDLNGVQTTPITPPAGISSLIGIAVSATRIYLCSNGRHATIYVLDRQGVRKEIEEFVASNIGIPAGLSVAP